MALEWSTIVPWLAAAGFVVLLVLLAARARAGGG